MTIMKFSIILLAASFLSECLAAPKVTTTQKAAVATTTTTIPCVNGATYTITPSASPTALQRFVMNCGYDYSGGDMQLIYAKTFKDCLTACGSTKGCVDLSWGSSNGFCYLKNVSMPLVQLGGIQVAKLLGSYSLKTTTTSTTTTRATTITTRTTTTKSATSQTLTSSTTRATASSTSSSTTKSVTLSSSSSSTGSSSSSSSSTTTTTSRLPSSSSSMLPSSSKISSLSSTVSSISSSSSSSTSTISGPVLQSSLKSSTTSSGLITSSASRMVSVSFSSSSSSRVDSQTTSSTSSSLATALSSTSATSSSVQTSPSAGISDSSSSDTNPSGVPNASSTNTVSPSGSASSTSSISIKVDFASSTSSIDISASLTVSSSSSSFFTDSSLVSTPSSRDSSLLSGVTSQSSYSSPSSSVTSDFSLTTLITYTTPLSSSTSILSSTTTSTSSSSSVVSATTTTTSTQPSVTPGVLPAPSDWSNLKGTAWNVTQIGQLGFGGVLGSTVTGDKCRTGSIGGKVIWNCGDIMCGGDWTNCGFSMGPAYYGTNSVMTIDSGGATNVGNNIFMPPWSGDVKPASVGQTAYGMDMSNVVAINNTHGVVFAWEILRGAADGSYVDQGNAVSSVTLTPGFPTATRRGPLLTGPNAIQLGLLASMVSDGYIYIYSVPNSFGVITVTRVPASDAVFDVNQYQTRTTAGQWVNGIPTPADATANYAMTTANNGGNFGCAVYGSVFYNAYLKKYTIICNIFMTWTNMYVSDTPWGPWSAEYTLLNAYGYGSMAHPEYSPDGGKTIYWSQGPNAQFDMYSLTFA